MFTGRHPYLQGDLNNSRDRLNESIARDSCTFEVEMLDGKVDVHLQAELAHLIFSMIKADPADR